MTTPTELAERLGLQDFRQFAQEAMWRLADVRFKYGTIPISEVMNRQQGRSTLNILAALCHLMDTEEDAVLVAHTKFMADLLVKRAGDWALHLGLDPRRIKATTNYRDSLVGRSPYQVFVDHVVRESQAL